MPIFLQGCKLAKTIIYFFFGHLWRLWFVTARINFSSFGSILLNFLPSWCLLTAWLCVGRAALFIPLLWGPALHRPPEIVERMSSQEKVITAWWWASTGLLKWDLSYVSLQSKGPTWTPLHIKKFIICIVFFLTSPSPSTPIPLGGPEVCPQSHWAVAIQHIQVQ